MNTNSLRDILRFYGKSRTHVGGKVRPFFAKMIAPFDTFDEKRHAVLLQTLEQTEPNLLCVYCGGAGNTVDHLLSTMLKETQLPTGYGHTYGNILPCCVACNSKKGNISWSHFANAAARRKIECMIDALPTRPSELDPEWEKLMKLRDSILVLLEEADQVAQEIHRRRGSA